MVTKKGAFMAKVAIQGGATEVWGGSCPKLPLPGSATVSQAHMACYATPLNFCGIRERLYKPCHMRSSPNRI